MSEEARKSEEVFEGESEEKSEEEAVVAEELDEDETGD